jgi:4,5-DOPA dioxygenase extradiol
VFLAHGSPMVALDDDDYVSALRALGARTSRPAAILCVSAHWEAPAPLRVGAAPRPRTIHDFGGFPDALYRLDYPAPGAPDLARAVVAALEAAGIPAVADPARGLDHGVWVPLRHAFPRADVPVVPLALPVPRAPADLVRVGRALEPFRDRGALLLGSGGIVHNLGRLDPRQHGAPVPPWAAAFDDWVREQLDAGDPAALLDYRRRAPHAALAVPTSEHFDPLLVVAGAAAPGERVADLHRGFQHGALSMRCLALGGS